MAIALVQHTGAAGIGPLAKAFTSNVTAGSLLVCAVRFGTVGGTYTISDNLNGAWTKDKTQLIATDGDTVIVASFPNSAGGAITVTANDGASGNQIYLAIAEFSGVATTSPVDGTPAGNNATGTSATSNNVTPTQSGDLIFGACGVANSNTFTQGAGFTFLDDAATGGHLADEYQILAGSGATAATFTLGASDEYGCIAVAYKVAGSGGTSITPSAGTLALTGNAPSLSFGTVLTPLAGALVLTGHLPTINPVIQPPSGSLALTGHVPTVNAGGNISLVPTAGALAFTGTAPSVLASATISPPAGSLALSGHAPSIQTGLSITPTAGSLLFTGVVSSQTLTLMPPAAGAMNFSGHAPTVTISGNLSITPAAGTLSLSGHAPLIGGSIALTPPAGTLGFTGHASLLTQSISLQPPAGHLTLTGVPPLLSLGGSRQIQPPSGALTFSAVAPGVFVPLPSVACAGGSFDSLTPMPGLML